MQIDEVDIERQIEWSRATFGPGKRTKGVIEHIRKELIEVEAKPDDLSEWIDLLILALDGAWRNTGKEPWKIISMYHEKMEKNYARSWPDWRGRSEDEAIEHDRTKDAPIKPVPGACRHGRARCEECMLDVPTTRNRGKCAEGCEHDGPHGFCHSHAEPMTQRGCEC